MKHDDIEKAYAVQREVDARLAAAGAAKRQAVEDARAERERDRLANPTTLEDAIAGRYIADEAERAAATAEVTTGGSDA